MSGEAGWGGGDWGDVGPEWGEIGRGDEGEVKTTSQLGLKRGGARPPSETEEGICKFTGCR